MKKLIPLLVLGMAFGVVEGSVVVYLRPYLNPGKADFSLSLIRPDMLTAAQTVVIKTEIFREAATLVLLGSAAAVAARSFLSWFCYFVFTFAVWDIVYYCWLYLRIGWPGSLFDWDVLFLIPVMWFAPVIVPCLISLAGIGVSVLVLRALDLRGRVKAGPLHWAFIVTGLVLWQVSFVNRSAQGVTAFPHEYSWWLFWAGMACVFAGAACFYRDNYMAWAKNK